MDWHRDRAASYLALVAGAIIAYTLAYYTGMRLLEGDPRSLIRSLEVVVQTFTTVGYGEDAPWSSPWMNVLVIAMQLSGVALVFLALPLFVAPWFERRLELTVPTSTDLTDHVVVCGVTPRTETLTDELAARGVPHVIVTPDREMARDLHDADQPVVHGDLESTDTLADAGVPDAAAVVLDAGDEINAATALSVREIAPERQVVALLEDPDLAEYLQLAGVDSVLSPRELLGHTLAQKVTSSVTTRLGDEVSIGDDFDIAELPIQHDAPLDGQSIAESGVRERTGASIIGAWVGGEFVPGPEPDLELDRSTVLLVAGSEAQLAALDELTRSERRGHRHERVLVGGYGEVGHAATDVLDDADIPTTVVDRDLGPGVDVVGEINHESTLRDARVEDATALVLALPDDTETIFTVLVARDLNPEIEIVCRANEVENASKLYRAGADYVLALGSVAGRMLAGAVLDEAVIGLDVGVEIVRTPAPELHGETLESAAIRERTGCTVIAVERDGEVITDLSPSSRLESGDELVVAGTSEAISAFHDLAGAETSPRHDPDD